jgi:hypothetical protein
LCLHQGVGSEKTRDILGTERTPQRGLVLLGANCLLCHPFEG